MVMRWLAETPVSWTSMPVGKVTVMSTRVNNEETKPGHEEDGEEVGNIQRAWDGIIGARRDPKNEYEPFNKLGLELDTWKGGGPTHGSKSCHNIGIDDGTAFLF